MKHLIITIVFLGFAEAMFGQTNVKAEKVNTDKITLAPAKIEQDSAMATWPVLVSVAEGQSFKTPAVRDSNGKYSLNFYPEQEKGIIYIEFENLPKAIKPDLYFSNAKGDVIYKIRAKSRLNVINLRKVPPGTYLLTTDVEEEISTWEVVKE